MPGRWALLLLLLPLAGCGFHPLYGGSQAAAYDARLASIEVRPVAERDGQLLAAALREQLNPDGGPHEIHYVLNVTLTIARSELGIRRDNTSSRGELQINAELSLHPPASNQVLFRDSIRSFTAFNLPDDAYAAVVAEQKARREAAEDLGREIARRLALYLHRQGGA